MQSLANRSRVNPIRTSEKRSSGRGEARACRRCLSDFSIRRYRDGLAASCENPGQYTKCILYSSPPDHHTVIKQSHCCHCPLYRPQTPPGTHILGRRSLNIGRVHPAGGVLRLPSRPTQRRGGRRGETKSRRDQRQARRWHLRPGGGPDISDDQAKWYRLLKCERSTRIHQRTSMSLI